MQAGGPTVQMEGADGQDDVEWGAVYRVQLEDETDDYQRINDAIAAIDAGDEDDQLERDEQPQHDDEAREAASRATTGADRHPAALNQYEQLRLRVQLEFDRVSEQVKRSVASSGWWVDETMAEPHNDAAPAFEPLSSSPPPLPSPPPPSSASPTTATTAGTATSSTATVNSTSRSLSSLSNLALSEWLSTGRPLPLRSTGEVGWQRELESQSALFPPGRRGPEQAAGTSLSLGGVLANAASYRKALSDLTAPLSGAEKPLLAAHSTDRSAVDAILASTERHFHKVRHTALLYTTARAESEGWTHTAAALACCCATFWAAACWLAARLCRTFAYHQLVRHCQRRDARVVTDSALVRAVRVAAAAVPGHNAEQLQPSTLLSTLLEIDNKYVATANSTTYPSFAQWTSQPTDDSQANRAQTQPASQPQPQAQPHSSQAQDETQSRLGGAAGTEAPTKVADDGRGARREQQQQQLVDGRKTAEAAGTELTVGTEAEAEAATERRAVSLPLLGRQRLVLPLLPRFRQPIAQFGSVAVLFATVQQLHSLCRRSDWQQKLEPSSAGRTRHGESSTLHVGVETICTCTWRALSTTW